MDISMCLKDRINEFWIAVFTKEPDLQFLCNVLLGLLTVPHSSAACECLFSCVRKNVTDQRSTLANQTIEALLVLKSRPNNFTKEWTDDQLDRLKKGEKLHEICNRSNIIHLEKRLCVVGYAVYAVGKALDSIFCKCSGSNDPVEKWPFLDYNVPEKEIISIQIMADQLLLIHSKMGISFLDPQSLELVLIQMGQKGSLTLTEDSMVILGNFEVFSVLGTKTWQEENKKITHVGLGLNHHLIVMELVSYSISFDCCETMCGLPTCQNTLKLIFSIPMPGVPVEVCFINRSVGFFVSITQHSNCTSYYQEMILQIDYFGKLRGVLPCLGPGPRSFFQCYLHGDSDLQANNREQGQAGSYVYLRDGHDGIIAIRPAM
ncbi:hypothetical protein CHS0354_037833 [Potamilus streckersoni]|uniref:HAT C-terminal dimerisation domain-containing protein n=1 Tax=Potamilus streckersoni TaxID=2493646 RepID=A0AAE0VXD1_9BIVA|nr:hypothetical protein CHS0354_037833 [Potamilus streckersoni]